MNPTDNRVWTTERELAFAIPWKLCTPEQRALREEWLPTIEGDPRREYEDELIHRLQTNQWLSISDKKRARRLIKERAHAPQA